MDDPANFFVISTDFCHWGSRFDFISYDKSAGPISASIEALDRQGMFCITEQDATAFTSYLKQTGNTICGRHPVGVMLKAIEHAKTPFVRARRFARTAVPCRTVLCCAVLCCCSVRSCAGAKYWR
jgi:AmmeMemoRadiSam system protein B